jgi:hypothetical protein
MKKINLLFLGLLLFASCTTPSRLGISEEVRQPAQSFELADSRNINLNISPLTKKDNYNNIPYLKSKLMMALNSNAAIRQILQNNSQSKIYIDITPSEKIKRTWILDIPFYYPCCGYWPFTPWWGKTILNAKIVIETNPGEMHTFNLSADNDFFIAFYPYYKAGRVMTEKYASTYNDLFQKIGTCDYSEALKNVNPSNYIPTIKPVQNTNIATNIDVDNNIPIVNDINSNTFAVVFGNEDYSKEIKVTYAAHDAQVFKEYLVKTMGVPEKNVHLAINATFGQMLGELDWINNVAKAFQGKAKLIFYYAGHGMPDKTSNAYILPVDGSSTNTVSAVKLDYVYSKLNEYTTVSVTVFLDACFSGDSRNGMVAQGRGVKIKPKEDPITGNLVVFTAVTGDETAQPYNEKQHGLFTYYLLKQLQQSKGNTSFGELYNYISSNVNQQSAIEGKIQNPQVNVSPSMSNIWKSIKLK